MQFEILVQDVTTIPADVIVNSANNNPHVDGGVCGEIHKDAGKALEEVCETGQTVFTNGYNLPAKYIFYTVGPRYNMYAPEVAAELLASCYTSVLELAKKLGVKSIVFPTISYGTYGFPTKDAIKIACETICSYKNLHYIFDKIIFAVSSKEMVLEYYKALENAKTRSERSPYDEKKAMSAKFKQKNVAILNIASGVRCVVSRVDGIRNKVFHEARVCIVREEDFSAISFGETVKIDGICDGKIVDVELFSQSITYAFEAAQMKAKELVSRVICHNSLQELDENEVQSSVEEIFSQQGFKKSEVCFTNHLVQIKL